MSPLRFGPVAPEPPAAARPTSLRRYGLAVAAIVVAVVCSLLLAPYSARISSALYLVAVALSAWYGGLGPGLLAAGLGFLVVDYLLIPPLYTFAPRDFNEALTMLLLAVAALVIGSTNASLRAARRRAERVELAERQQREWLRTTLTSIGDAVIATDAQGAITFINPVAAALTGWPADEALGQPIGEVFRIVDEQTRQPADSPVARVLRDGTVQGLANHTVLLARDGREWPLDDSAAPIRDATGQINGVVLVFRDISDRYRADQARARLAAIVESSDDAIYSRTLDGVITSWNQGAERLFGYSAAEMIGQLNALLVPLDRPAEQPGANNSRLLRGERVEPFETVRQRKGGQVIDVSVSVSPILGAAGEVVGASIVARDVTAKKRAEAALRASEARFRRVIETSLVGIITWNRQSLITEANDAFLNLLGYSRDDLRAGRLRWPDLIPSEFRDVDQQRLAELQATGQLSPYQQDLLRQDGSRAPALVGSARFEGSTDEGVSFVLDVSERQELERAQQEFIAMVAHELRNPLASLKGFAQLTQYRGSYDERAVTAIIDQCNQLDRLIGDLVDASHLPTGRLELRRSQVDLIVLASAAVEQAQAESARHRILLQAPAGSLIGEWDPDRLSQVFRNLLSNAIKYSPAGGDILVGVDQSGATARVTIRDHGVGIDPAALPRLFERFYRADRGADSARGLGLGLFITHELIEAHGGRIWVESAGEGHGSVFQFTLPTGSTPQASIPVEPVRL